MKPQWIKTIRTAVQVALTAAALLPVLVPALGLSATVGVGAALVGAAAVVTRVMAIPAVSALLKKYLGIPE